MPSTEWTVKLSTIKLSKSIAQLPEHVRLKMFALAKDLESKGPMQPGWPNFSKLGDNSYHCHIKKGKPTYVVCSRVLSKEDKLLEIYYAGTHEKAPYL